MSKSVWLNELTWQEVVDSLRSQAIVAVVKDIMHSLAGNGFNMTVELFWNSKEQKEFAPQGHFTASNLASPEKGKKYHENMVENLVKFINWFKRL